MPKQILSLTVSFVLCLLSSSFTQNYWIKYNDPSTNSLPYLNSDPVLLAGMPGEWDYPIVSPRSVLYKDGVYHLWYNTGNFALSATIGYASSVDGIVWTKYNDPTTINFNYMNSDPIMLRPGAAGDWDYYGVHQPSVLWDANDSLYHLWYAGARNAQGNGPASIGYATSEDGINWIKYNDPNTTNPPYVNSDPVLDPGLPGSWDGRWIVSPSVLFDGDSLHMWYQGYSGSGQIVRIGHATSADGIHWQKDQNNPVFDPILGSWEFPDLRKPMVMYNASDSMFHMWYSGGIYAQINWQIGYAWSEDGSHWIRDSLHNPVLRSGAGGSWDHTYVAFCSVISTYPDSALRMWYLGRDAQIGHIGYATNPLCKLKVTPGSINHAINSGMTIQDSLIISNTGDPQARELRFTIESPGVNWLSFSSPLSDTLAAGELAIVYFTINTTTINNGTHSTRVKITSNDFFYSRLKVPVELQVVSDIEDKVPVSNQFSLGQNYPNPFNPTTVISWQLAVSSPLRLTVYDIRGKKIVTLVDEKMGAGSHSVEWDASGLASGVYLYRLETEGYVETRKMVLMK